MNYSRYFDYAAATPLDEEVLQEMLPYMQQDFYNPSALYLDAHRVRSSIELARSKVARILECKAQEILFTAGCTEANNLAIQGYMKTKPGKKIAVSAVEHDSVIEAAKQFEMVQIPVDTDGKVNHDALSLILDDEEVVMVSVMYVNNEIGTVQPLREIAAIIAAKNATRKGEKVIFHTDAAQASCYFGLTPHTLGVDMMSLNGGKMYGPKQTGCLYLAKHIELEPLFYGGKQERGLRSGTENVPGIIGFAAALEKACELRKEELSRVLGLRNMLLDRLLAVGAVRYGAQESTPHVLSVGFSGCDNERFLMQLDEKGFQVAVGSACHAKNGDPSRVLAAIGLSEVEAQSVVRISFGRFSDEESVRNLAGAIESLLV